ncbi:MAG: hypothetical protein AAF555_06440 [Verrucomicrobiota bacterium]
MTTKTLTSFFILLLGLTPSLPASVIFFADFTYTSAPDFSTITDASQLNGMVDQVGTFSGATNGAEIVLASTDPGSPTNPTITDALGYRDSRDGVDSLTILKANFSESADLADGVNVSFFLSTRRGNNNAGDNYDIVGFDSSGVESFRLTIGTDKQGGGQTERIGFVSSGTTTFDLPTTTGADAIGDLNVDNNIQTGAVINLALSDNGFTIDFAGVDSAGANSYTTDVLAYNGSATSISSIEFQLAAEDVDANGGDKSGFYLDNFQVSAIPETSHAAVLGGLTLCGLFFSRRRS